MLAVLLLGAILGFMAAVPYVFGWPETLKNYQTLLVGVVSIVAAALVFSATMMQIRETRRQAARSKNDGVVREARRVLRSLQADYFKHSHWYQSAVAAIESGDNRVIPTPPELPGLRFTFGESVMWPRKLEKLFEHLLSLVSLRYQTLTDFVASGGIGDNIIEHEHNTNLH